MHATIPAVLFLFTAALLVANVTNGPDGGSLAPADPRDVAIDIGRRLLAGDVDALTMLTPNGFAFDGRPVWNSQDARAEWVRALEQRSLAGVQLYGVEVLPYDEMVKRYGKPPARLSQMNLMGTEVAVVNLGGRAMLVIFKKHGEGWTPIGVSD
jgi:hypothetical protein